MSKTKTITTPILCPVCEGDDEKCRACSGRGMVDQTTIETENDAPQWYPLYPAEPITPFYPDYGPNWTVTCNNTNGTEPQVHTSGYVQIDTCPCGGCQNGVK